MTEDPQPAREGTLEGVRHSVRKKLMLVVLATTMVALLFAGAAMMLYDLRTYHQSWVNDLFAQAELIGRASAPALSFNDDKVAKENLALLKIRPGISAAAIYNAQGKRFATYARPDIASAQFPDVPQAEGYSVAGRDLILFKRIVENNELLGTVYFQARYELVDRLENYLGILAAVMVTSLLVALLTTSWLQKLITDPVAAITHVARDVMEKRDFSLRVRKTTQDEVGYLVDTFNAMLAEIGRRSEALLAADRRKDEFLATLAHELRNPMAPMRNALAILRLAGDNKQTVKSASDMMERQLRQLVHLVNDLLDVSRITTGKLVLKKERVELHDVVNAALETAGPLIDSRRHHLTVTLPDPPVYLFADAIRLAQVFLNLLNNAAKFTESGGDIILAAELQGGELVVTVSDTGIGIPPEMAPMIFDMFAQVDRSLDRTEAGLGVGLTLAKHLTALHGGNISVQSEGLGRGSRFTVRLPTIAEPELTAGAAVPQSGPGDDGPRHRILLADDNVDFAASLAMILQTMGHEVRVTHDGIEAAAAARAFKPDFAFLDIGLPKLNGYDLARRLRQMAETSDAVLVAVTGWGQEDDKRRAREAGFDHHMVKPVDPEQILAILRQAAHS